VSDDSLIISGRQELAAFVRAAGAAPQATALLCDIDGTISPIAPRPDDAVVPGRFLDVLRELIARLGLVAFVTGRALEDARRLVPLGGAAFVGTHGLETRTADGRVRAEAQAERFVAEIQEVASAAARDLDCERLGVVLENKRTVLAVHYRLAPDAATTRHEILTRVVEPARARGLSIGSGHFAFEVRPPVPFTKGKAARRLLDEGRYLAALACGDDLTDVTAFKAVREWGGQDARRHGCTLAAVTAETPRPVRDEADVLVRATPGVFAALTRLLKAVGG
jgi:trehalose 6-phosphate phosphatase